MERIDGLILSGGGDFNPLWAGEEPSPLLHGINKERDNAELLITRLAYNRQIPMLGICRGIQTLAMALGGKVAQDLTAADCQEIIKEQGDKKPAKRFGAKKTAAAAKPAATKTTATKTATKSTAAKKTTAKSASAKK